MHPPPRSQARPRPAAAAPYAGARPSRDGEAPPEPPIIDDLFISLNVSSTYGPSCEPLVSRTAKLVMALQVLLAILILTVLIARAVSSTS